VEQARGFHNYSILGSFFAGAVLLFRAMVRRCVLP